MRRVDSLCLYRRVELTDRLGEKEEEGEESGDLLEECYEVVVRNILSRQNQYTGLLSTNDEEEGHAWVRDNVSSISAVWALSMAYRRRLDAGMAVRSYLLERATIRCMRGLLTAMMGQREKVERFKTSFSPSDALHAKYCAQTGKPVVGDNEWGHLQIDATALFILTLAQMTTSGLNIIFTLDEVSFVQNLVFYIECAYIIPDYGMWERGDKSNQNIVELNSSSVGMAKAALAAINGVNLFGGKGSETSVIHVIPDEISKCGAVLETMLPRGSHSKETDAGILTITGYPGFAIKKEKLANETVLFLLDKLRGKYGLKRFLRDGYKTCRENTSKLHYESWELRLFENIECEWPMFLCYLSINYVFSDKREEARQISSQIDGLRVLSEGSGVLPELYQVPDQWAAEESVRPGSTERVAGGRQPFMWTQALFVINKLLVESQIQPAELDPLNTRLKKFHESTVVQVVVLAEDLRIKSILAAEGIEVQTTKEILPYQVRPARVLSQLYTFLGRNEKLGMSGRRTLDVGIETTSRFYKIQDKMFVFTPQSFDKNLYYTDSDPALAISTLKFGLNYLSNSWSDLGRPTVTLLLTNDMIGEDGSFPEPITDALHKINAGYIYGTRVDTGDLSFFQSTSSIVDLGFLGDIENGEQDKLQPQVHEFLDSAESELEEAGVLGSIGRQPEVKRKLSSTCIKLMGSIRKSHSIRYSLEESKDILQGLMNERYDKERAVKGSNSPMVPFITKIGPPPRLCSPRRSRDEQNISSYPDIEELVEILMESEDLQEQGDVLHYLVVNYGMEYDTGRGTVVELVSELYARSVKMKCWSLVRHTSGLLCKKIPNLALSLTELLVRQRQVTVGLPPHHEVVVSHPLSAKELRDLIYQCHEGDISTAALTQEVLTCLAKFIRSEPDLFHGMIRIRIGLIIQVRDVAQSGAVITSSFYSAGDDSRAGQDSKDPIRGGGGETAEHVSLPDQQPSVPHHDQVRSLTVITMRDSPD